MMNTWGEPGTERWRKIIRMRERDIEPHPGPALSKLGRDKVRKQPVRKEERKIAWRNEKQVRAWLRSKPLRIVSQLTEKKSEPSDTNTTE